MTRRNPMIILMLLATWAAGAQDNGAGGAALPVEAEQIVLAQPGSEHFANAVYRTGRGGPRIAAWGSRIVQWPIAANAQTEEVVAKRDTVNKYSNGGCAMDIDGDGIDEVVVASYLGNGADGSDLMWYEEVSDSGTWREHKIARLEHGTGGAPHDILPLHTVDASGNELRGVAAVIGRRKLVWFETPEDIRSEWTARPIVYLPADKQSGMAIGDIAGNGRPDIACGMFWVECPPDPATGPWKARRYGTWDENGWGGMTKHGLGDFDGDGKLDIVATEAEIPESRLAIFRRDSDSPEGLWKPTMIDTGLYCPHSLVVVDVNGDGLLDIVVGEMTAGGWSFPLNPDARILLYLNEGDLKFTRHTLATGWGVHEMKVTKLGPENQFFLYAADEIQPHKFDDMKTHVVGWKFVPRP